MSAGAMFAHVRTGPEGFSITLPVPYSRLLDVTREVCGNGIIHGTYQYEQESAIGGARAAGEAAAFPPWKGAGEACYKIRENTLAPAHFVASNDMGAITVRYVVEPLGPDEAHISIDAVFVEDGHRRRHVSQGLVETAEFREVAMRLKALADAESEAAAAAERREREARQKEIRALRGGLDSANAAIARLRTQAESLRLEVLARIAAPAAELKAAPLSRAQTTQRLEAGQTVKLLRRTAYWDLVRTQDGHEGWIYYLLLEALP